MKNVIKVAVLLLVATLLLGTLVACGGGGGTGADVTVLEKGKSSSYLLLYGDGDLSKSAASTLRDLLAEKGYQRFNGIYQYKTVSEANEIILGESDRAASKKAMEELGKKVAASPDDFHWAICYDDGKLAIVASSALAYDMAFDDLFENYVKKDAIVVKSDLNKTNTKTLAQYNEELAELSRLEAEKKKEENRKLLASLLPLVNKQRTDLENYTGRINMYDAKDPEINLFSQYTENIGTPSWGTTNYNVSDEHPRLLLTKDDLPQLRINLAKNNAFTERFLAKLDETIPDDCILPAPEKTGTNEAVGKDNIHNYNDNYLEIIQTKALGYLAYDDQLYGYQAIYYMKNFLKSLDIKQIGSDQCREYGYTMYTAALVYDWCYDLLTEDDKIQFIAGVENCLCRGSNFLGHKMEIGFPPSEQSSVAGHACEYQILRDYLSFSIAIYDENPSWWNYIASRITYDFAPMRNYYVQSGIIHQGVGYSEIRHIGDLYANWLMTIATGESPFVGIDQPIRGIIGSEATAGSLFTDGDCNGDLKNTSQFVSLIYMVAYLYEDSTLLAQANYLKGDSAFTGFLGGLSNPSFLALSSLSDIQPSADRYEGMELIQYFGSPLGQYVVRSSWTDDSSAAVFMRIKERSTANHEHCDAGTFQIYYKGMLTSDGGVYYNYGSNHNQYYNQATISHNGLIIYNSSKKNTENGWYSGGQIKYTDSNNYAIWENNPTAKTGLITGYQHAYKDDAKTQPLYAYLAGDITSAYDSTTATYVGRRMLTVYTDSEEFPMVFFVFDDITATSRSHEKRFLLQIVSSKAPTVSRNTVTTENGDGKLVLTCLTEDVDINKVGGRNSGDAYNAKLSSNYMIEGKQLAPENVTKDDGHWGRIEIVHTSNKTSATFMNVIYVTDKGNKNAATVESITNAEGLEGGVFQGQIVGLFATSRTGANTALSCTTKGNGNMSYYVSGVAAGNWTVSVNGQSVGTFAATAEGGLLTFTAPAGNVTITPAK